MTQLCLLLLPWLRTLLNKKYITDNPQGPGGQKHPHNGRPHVQGGGFRIRQRRHCLAHLRKEERRAPTHKVDGA